MSQKAINKLEVSCIVDADKFTSVCSSLLRITGQNACVTIIDVHDRKLSFCPLKITNRPKDYFLFLQTQLNIQQPVTIRTTTPFMTPIPGISADRVIETSYTEPRHDDEILTRDHSVEPVATFYSQNGTPVDLMNLYLGANCFLLCNGPSLCNIDRSRLKLPGIFTIGMNNGFVIFRPHLWTSVDNPARFPESIWKDATIQKFVPVFHFNKRIWIHAAQRFSAEKLTDFPSIIGVRHNDSFDPDTWLSECTINWGNDPNFGGARSVLLFTLRICHILGFRKVYLVGCDFKMEKSHPYCYQVNVSEHYASANNRSYEILADYLRLLKPRFETAGFHVYNTTSDSNLDVFPYVPLEQAIDATALDTTDIMDPIYQNMPM